MGYNERAAVKTKHEMGEKFQGVLFDIDGVLEFQGKAYPGAVELLEVLRRKRINILFWEITVKGLTLKI